MSPQRNAQFFSHDFEEEAVAHCSSKLSKTLPHCSFSDMEQPTFLEFEGKELDGFGYILDDSVVSRADGIVLLKFPGGQCTNPPPKTRVVKTPTKNKRQAEHRCTLRSSPWAKARFQQNDASKYIFVEACMNVSKYSGELNDSDKTNEAEKAQEKLGQVDKSVKYLKRRYVDQRARNQEIHPHLPHESTVVGAAYLAMYCYCDGSNNDAKSKRFNKVTRIQEVLELKLESMWLEHTKGGGDINDVEGVLKLAKEKRLFLVVLSNREACRTTTNIDTAKELQNIRETLEDHGKMLQDHGKTMNIILGLVVILLGLECYQAFT